MAKDKDKQQDQQQQQQAGGGGGGNLFSGVDGDKAITFQRAVFIVCNLKRIIRRPKKDQHDKSHLAAGANSRKRSGDSGKGYDGARSSSGLPDGGAADENHHGPGGGGRGLRFRNPIRRAFTLPVILCESFAGTTSAQISGNDDDDDLYTLDGGQPPSDQSPTTAIDSPPVATSKLRFSVPTGSADQSQEMGEHDHARLRRSPARRQRRRDKRNTGTGDTPATTSPLSFNALECDINRAAADAVQLGSLSCLVTPIRRANQTSKQQQQITKSAARSKGARKSVQIPAFVPSPSSSSSSLLANQTTVFHHQRPPGDCHGNIRQLATGGTSPPICCPIWSLAMELLDMSQLQPRDQTRHSHLLGAPASAPHLLVPAPQATQVTDQPKQQSLVSQAGSDGESQSLLPPPPNIQVDTGDAPTNQDDDESETQQPHRREKRLSSESISEQRMICDRRMSKGGVAGSSEHNNQSSSAQSKSRNQIDEDQATAAARLRMKRFSSSALCLNEPPATTPEAVAQHTRRDHHAADKSHATRNQKKRTDTTSGEGTPKRSGSSSKKSSSRTLAPTPLETLDPIVQYARQRRPSVSNQGTLNVDQQALFSAVECNQLERVKSILDGGGGQSSTATESSAGGDAPKVNVNSLNGDKLTCLDVAVLLRNTDMVRLLQAYGAKESSACLTREGRENQLYGLYMEARRLVEDLSRSLNAIGGSAAAAAQPGDQFHLGDPSDCLGGGPSLANSPTATPTGSAEQQQHAKPQQLMLATGSLLSSALFEEKQRQLAYWRRRLELFMQMRYGFEKLAVPNAPELVVLQVVGESSLGVKIVHSLQLSREHVAMPAVRTEATGGTVPVAPPNDQDQDGKSQGPLHRRHRKPLRKLVARAQDRKLVCPAGLNCTHWLMDEFVAHKHQSDQFQMPPITSGEAVGESTPSSGSNKTTARAPVAEFATVKSARQRGAALNASNASQRQHQEKLAIFNQLLAQQLTILSNQQRQQQRLELANNSSRFRIATSQKPASQQQQQREQQVVAAGTPRLPRSRPQHLLCAHQAESTDSAYDNLAAAAASSRRHQQQAQQLSSMLTVQATSSLQFSPSSTGLAGYAAASKTGHDSPATLGSVASTKQQQPYRSLAYQLMSAKKRYSPADGSPTLARPTDSLPFDAQGRVSNFVATADEIAPQSPDCDLDEAAGAGGHLVQMMAKSPAIITKYLVEWSPSDSFEPLAGSMIIYNTNCYPLECRIEQLANGRVYFVRVASGNHRGFSEARPTTPTCLAPSSWRQVSVGTSAATSQAASRKRFKYDEEVFRKFTKLILLNRHILDKNQIQMLQREQQSLLSASAGQTRGPGRDLLKSGNLQNKSSLINMLLLDATLPAPGMSAQTGTSRRTKQNQVAQTGGGSGGGGLSLANKLPVLDVTAASHSPRGSLYPSSTSTRASVTGAGDSMDRAGYETSDSTASGEQQQTSLRVRKNLKSFFQSNSAKFNKLNNQNKRGLYLTTVIYCPGASGNNQPLPLTGRGVVEPKEGFGFDSSSGLSSATNPRKLVVTNDDRLPVIEILNELVAPSSLMADFYWLLKINGTNWIDIKRLRQQLQKSHSSSTLHLRIKLLAAIEQMQVALNLEDIGRLFYKPIVAHDGSIVICTCRCVSNTKQQREKQLEIQQQQAVKRRQQQQQQQRHHSSASTCTGLSQMGPDGSLSNPCYQQQVTIGTSCSSSAHSSQDPLTATSSTPTTENNNLTPGYQAQNHAPGAITLSTCGGGDDQQVVAVATCAGVQPNQPAEVGLGSNQQTNNRLLSASNAQLAMMPPELARLCESCQQALIQRRCTMASGSSSSSLASSQESQSTWSSSQFSLTSQQAAIAGHQQQQRSCTCSRSNSANQVLTAAPVVNPYSSGQQQQQNHVNNPTPTCSGPAANNNNNLLPSNHTAATSAPTSQRNSTHSARSASGSMSMMMMMMMGGGGGVAGTPGGVNLNQPHVQSSGSFSLAHSSGYGTGATPTSASGTAAAATAGSPNQRQTQSQQLTEAATPQKSSTYLMLASLGLYDLLLFHLSEIIEFDQASTRPLQRGLYLGFVQLQTTVESMRLLVPRRRPNMVPCARVRDNAHVSREEWDLLKKFPLISSLCSAERSQVAMQGCASSRCSDPAIWGGSVGAGGSPISVRRQQEEDEDHLQATAHRTQPFLSLESGGQAGFDRDRAKSVSPGLIKCIAGGCAASSAAAAAATHRHHLDPIQSASIKSSVPGKTQHSASSSALGLESTLVGTSEQAQHAHSDTDLTTQVVNACGGGLRPVTKTHPASRTQESAVSDSNLALDRANNADEEPAPLARGKTHTPRTSRRLVPSSLERAPEMTFVRLIGDAAKRLLSELKSQLPKHFEQTNDSVDQNSPGKEQLVSILNSLNDEPNNRIYHLELIELSNQVTFVLLIPAPENVCPVTSHERSNILANNRDFMLLPLQIFETIHLATYEPDLLGKYSRLSTILETDLIVAQHEHRQAFSSHEIKSTKSRVSHLQDMVAIADEFWRQLRWIVDVVSFARDKSGSSGGGGSLGGCLKLATIWRHFDQLAASASRASITSASTIANLCCIETTCLAAAAAAVGSASRRHESEPGEEDEEDEEADQEEQATPRARTSSVDENLRGDGNRGTAAVAASSRAGEHAEIKRTSSAKQTSAGRTRAPRLPEIQLPSSEAAQGGETTTRGSQPNSHVEQKQANDTCGLTTRVSLDDDEDQESILDVEFGTLASRADTNRSDQDHGQQTPRVEDEEEAIYAYHISLRDATRAAAQRKSSHAQQQHASNVSEICLQDPRSSSDTNGLASDDDRLASTCGGLNLDRRQFEQIAAMAAARAARSESHARDSASESSGRASGHVTAYKCKVRDSASASSSSANRVRLDEDDLGARQSGAPEREPETTEAGGPAASRRPAGRRLTGQLLKSTNPFLTDSFDL